MGMRKYGIYRGKEYFVGSFCPLSGDKPARDYVWTERSLLPAV